MGRAVGKAEGRRDERDPWQAGRRRIAMHYLCRSLARTGLSLSTPIGRVTKPLNHLHYQVYRSTRYSIVEAESWSTEYLACVAYSTGIVLRLWKIQYIAVKMD